MNKLQSVVCDLYDSSRTSADAEIDAQRDREIEASVNYYATIGRDHIGRRLTELDQEWDIERTLEMKAASIAFVGVVLGFLGRRRWLLAPMVVLPFLLQHAMHGSCGPVRALRRFGILTRHEIDRERYALRALRGGLKEQARPAPEASSILLTTAA